MSHRGPERSPAARGGSRSGGAARGLADAGSTFDRQAERADIEALARQLLSVADAERFANPHRARARAQAARDWVASLAPEELGESEPLGENGGQRRWLELQCDAWSVLASAQRGVGELEQAESSMLVALHFLGELSPSDEVRRARISLRAGYIRLHQGRRREALELMRLGHRLYLESGLRQRAAAAEVDIAVALGRSESRSEQARPGRQQAVDRLASALEVLDPEVERRSYVAGVHNMARLLLEMAEEPAQEEEALRWLELAAREHRRFPERLHLLRLQAIAALTAARLGRVHAALSKLDALAKAFEQIGSVGDQVLALLYGAEISLRYPTGDRAADRRRTLEMTGRLFPLLRQLPLDASKKSPAADRVTLDRMGPDRVAPDSPAKSALIRLLARAEAQELNADAVRRAADLVERSLG